MTRYAWQNQQSTCSRCRPFSRLTQVSLVAHFLPPFWCRFRRESSESLIWYGYFQTWENLVNVLVNAALRVSLEQKSRDIISEKLISHGVQRVASFFSAQECFCNHRMAAFEIWGVVPSCWRCWDESDIYSLKAQSEAIEHLGRPLLGDRRHWPVLLSEPGGAIMPLILNVHCVVTLSWLWRGFSITTPVCSATQIWRF